MNTEQILFDYLFLTFGHFLDMLTTYIFVKKYGINAERNHRLKYRMMYHGVLPAILLTLVIGIVGNFFIIILLYYADKGLGIEAKLINIHHLAAYFMGVFKYIATIFNISVTFRLLYISKYTYYILSFYRNLIKLFK